MTAGMERARVAEESGQRADPVLWLLIAAIFVVSIDSRVITPILPAIADDFDVSIGRAGLIVTAYLLPYGLFQLAYGPVADRVGQVRVVSLALGGFAVGASLCALAPDLLTLVGARLWTGLAAAAVFPLTLAYIGETIPYSQRQNAIGYTVMASAIGQVLSSAAGGFLAALLSWRAIFLLDGVIALGITVAMLTQRAATTRPDRERRSALAAFRVVLRDRRHVLFYLLIFIEGSLTLGAFSYFGAMLHDRDGFSFTALGFVIALFGLSSIVTGRYIGRLVRRVGEQRMILAGGLGSAACYGLTTLQPAVVFVSTAMLALGSAWIMMHSTLQTRATELAPQARATGIALFAFALFLGSSLGAFLVAQSIEALGYNRTMLVLGGATAAFAVTAAASAIPWSQADAAPGIDA